MHNIFILTYPRSGSTAYSSLLINSLNLDRKLGEHLMVRPNDVHTDTFNKQLQNYSTVYRYFPWDEWDEHSVIEYMYYNTQSKKILVREIQDWILSRLFLEQTKQYNVNDTAAIKKEDIDIDLTDSKNIGWINSMCSMTAKLMRIKESYPDFEIVRYEDINFSKSSLIKQWDKDFKISKCRNFDILTDQIDVYRKNNVYFSKYLNTIYKDMLWY